MQSDLACLCRASDWTDPKESDYIEKFYVDLGYKTISGTSTAGSDELITMEKATALTLDWNHNYASKTKTDLYFILAADSGLRRAM